MELEYSVNGHHGLHGGEEIVAEADQKMIRHQGYAGVGENDTDTGVAVVGGSVFEVGHVRCG